MLFIERRVARRQEPGDLAEAVAPDVRRVPVRRCGLNYDPSHLVWQFMDPVRPICDFPDRLYHVHAKDVRILKHKLQECGILDFGWNVPEAPGPGRCGLARRSSPR